MAVNPLCTTDYQLLTTGGSNSSAQQLAASTTGIQRLLSVTLINTGTNTGALRLYVGVASSGQPLVSAKLTGGQHSSQHFEFGDKGVNITSGLLARGALGTVLSVINYVTE